MNKKYKILIVFLLIVIVIVGCKKNEEEDIDETREQAAAQRQLEWGEVGELPSSARYVGRFNIDIEKPEEGASFYRGEIVIEWTLSSYYSGSEPWDITIYAMNRDTSRQITVTQFSQTTDRSGSYNWRIPDNIVPGEYQLKMHINNGSLEDDALSRTFGIRGTLEGY